jgi:DNA invertase Pin-like site-specific DNA recombinase
VAMGELSNPSLRQSGRINAVDKSKVVLGYTRVSTTEQAESGLGLAAQKAAIKAECERRHWEVLDVVADEGVSGKSLDRPALSSALERIAAGEAQGLVAAKLDRLSRSVRDFADLLEWFEVAGAALVALDVGVDTSTPGGKLISGIFSAVSEWERDTIAARTKESLAARRAQGKPISRAAVADNPEMAQRIRAMRAKGLTYQAIADALNAEQIPTVRSASKWTVSSVRGAAGYKAPKVRKKVATLPKIGRSR